MVDHLVDIGREDLIEEIYLLTKENLKRTRLSSLKLHFELRNLKYSIDWVINKEKMEEVY